MAEATSVYAPGLLLIRNEYWPSASVEVAEVVPCKETVTPGIAPEASVTFPLIT